jgi:integrase
LTGGWRWRFRVRWTDPATGSRPVEEFDTIDEALDFLAHIRLARRRGVLAELTRGQLTLTAFFETEYWPRDAKRNLQLNTRKTYLPVWYSHLKPRLGHLQLRQLTPPTVQALREQMEEDGIGAATIRRAMAILQAVCRYAIERGEIAGNPVKDVRKPPARRQLAVVAISPRQIETLRQELDDPASRLLISLLAYEGLRPEEALALGDRHMGKRTLLIERKLVDGQILTGQKTSRPPRVPELWAPVRRDLAEYRLTTTRADIGSRQLLFPRADGDPWREHDYRNWRRRVFKPAVKRAGLPISRPYDLRHACASLMIHAGKPLTEISEHLGNSVAVLSETYAHLIADMRGQPPKPVADAIMTARSNQARATG